MADKTELSSYSKPKNEEEWLAKIDSIYSEQEKSRHAYEQQWYLNIAFYIGQQWAQWSNVTKRLEEPKVPKWRVRLVANRILSHVQLTIAKMTKTKPTMVVIPATSEEEDRNAARIGDKVLSAFWRKLDMDIRLFDWLLWMLTCSSGFAKVYWNPKAGPRMEYPIDTEGEPIVSDSTQQMPAKDESGEPIIQAINLGDVKIDIVSPFEIFLDYRVSQYGCPRWIMHARPMAIDEIQQMYPEKGGQVRSEQDITSGSFFERRIMTQMSSFGASGASQTEQNDESAVLKEYWEIPSDKFPRGKLVVVANKVILQDTEWPDEYLEPTLGLHIGPFVRLTDIPVPGRPWGQAVIEQLIPLQKNYNRARSQVIESRNLMSKPKVLEPKGSQIAESAITSEPGERVQYVPINGAKPEFWTPPSIPNYVFNEMEMTLRDMEEVSQIHQVSKGQAPQGVRAGIAIRFLQEQDDTGFGPKIRQMELALSRVGSLILRIVKEHYRESRTLQIVGANRDIEVFDFQGADLRNCTDVSVQAGSGFPELKSAKQQYILELFQQGLFGNPQEEAVRGKVLRMLELGDVDTAFEDERKDERWAEQENRLMAEGTFSEPQYFENHAVHLNVLHGFMKTASYRALEPSLQELFKQHAVLHAQLLAPEPPQPIGMSGQAEVGSGEEGPSPSQEPPLQAPSSPQEPMQESDEYYE